MIKTVHINSVNFGSTGSIALSLAKLTDEKYHGGSLVFVPKCRANKATVGEYDRLFSDRLSSDIHLAFTRLTGFHGCFSFFATLSLIKKLKKIQPDIIHLHNLHNSYINIPLLFNYIKKNNVKTVWTLHDCWAFTGQCPHFVMAKCDRWKTGCHSCSQYRNYPMSYVDRTKTMWRLKRKWFTGVKAMTLVTPSRWLGDLVGESFLREYPLRVINNGIDLSVFKPTEGTFRQDNAIGDGFMVLGVANHWNNRKGLDAFVELSKRLDSRFKVVIVGVSDEQRNNLPENIIALKATKNQKELAEIYTAADVFVNPTREEVFGLVNAEALSCGTPVITFKTGGSPEVIDESCGIIVECDDVETLCQKIEYVCIHRPFSQNSCTERAKTFDKNERFKEYLSLYEDFR